MNAINIQVGPSSWDRDLQGLDEDPESENLTALGMHLMAANNDEEEDDEEDVEKPIDANDDDDNEEEDKDEPEELDELKELDRLEKELKQEDEPALIIIDEDE
jgi:hypothetical protein